MLRKRRYRLRDPSGRIEWIDVEIHHDGRYGAPGEKRRKRQRPTPEMMAKQNLRNKARKIWQLLRCNFSPGDHWLTFTYRRGQRPDQEKAMQEFSDLRRKISRWYRRNGKKAKYIYSIEVGSKGGIHMHMVLNRAADADLQLQKLWPAGRVYMEGLYQDGDFRDLAEYIAKATTYNHSRNLEKPKAERPKAILRIRMEQYPKADKGYVVDKQSVYQGYNAYTGLPYLQYTMVRFRRD